MQVLQSRYHSRVYRPRLLILGKEGMGQSELAAALLQNLEELPVHPIDYASLSR